MSVMRLEIGCTLGLAKLRKSVLSNFVWILTFLNENSF